MSHLASTWGLLLLLPLVLSQQYELTQTYTAQNFFDEFRFYTGPDPTDGFVQYVPLETAAHNRLVGNESGLIYLGVDSTNVYPAGGPGRPSVRLESKSTFTEGLFVLDLTHIPTGCGIWPAFWTVGLGDWPVDGEIDIIENVNDAIHNNAALHAAGECGVSNATDQTGSWKSTDCNIEHDKNQGCGTEFSEPYNFGEGFNRNGGGVYAMEWTSSAINIWFFPSNAVPESISSPESFYSSHSHPDPSTFNRPSASFAGDCSSSFTDKFFNHTIVFDTTFCGGWAGGTFGNEGSQCQRSAYATSSESCVDFVGSNPEAFSEAYWAFKSLRVWQKVPGFAPMYYTNQSMSKPELATPSVPLGISKPVPKPVVVSLLTGGVITTDEDLDNIHPAPLPLDPEVGDGTYPEIFEPVPSAPVAIEFGIGDGSGPEAFGPNPEDTSMGTEGRITDGNFPAPLSLPVPPISGVQGVISPVHGISNTVAPIQHLPAANIWSALGDNAQDQLLALADSLVTAPPIDAAPDPALISQGPVVPALDTEDTNKAVGGILDLMDQSTKNQLFSFLAPTSQVTSDISRQEVDPADMVDELDELINGDVANPDSIPEENVGSNLADSQGTSFDNLDESTRQAFGDLIDRISSSIQSAVELPSSIMEAIPAILDAFRDTSKIPILQWLTDSEELPEVSFYPEGSLAEVDWAQILKNLGIESLFAFTTAAREVDAYHSLTDSDERNEYLGTVAQAFKNAWTTLGNAAKNEVLGALTAQELVAEDFTHRKRDVPQQDGGDGLLHEHNTSPLGGVKDFITQYHTIGQSLLDLDTEQLDALSALFAEDSNLDADTVKTLKSFDDKIKDFVIRYYFFGQAFSETNAEDRALLSELLQPDETQSVRKRSYMSKKKYDKLWDYRYGLLTAKQRDKLHSFVSYATICALQDGETEACLATVAAAYDDILGTGKQLAKALNSVAPDYSPSSALIHDEDMDLDRPETNGTDEHNYVPHTRPSPYYLDLINPEWILKLRDFALQATLYNKAPSHSAPQSYVDDVAWSLQQSWHHLDDYAKDGILTVLAPCPESGSRHCDEEQDHEREVEDIPHVGPPQPPRLRNHKHKRGANEMIPKPTARPALKVYHEQTPDDAEEEADSDALQGVMGEPGTTDPYKPLKPQEEDVSEGIPPLIDEEEEEQEDYTGDYDDLDTDSVDSILPNLEGLEGLSPLDMLEEDDEESLELTPIGNDDRDRNGTVKLFKPTKPLPAPYLSEDNFAIDNEMASEDPYSYPAVNTPTSTKSTTAELSGLVSKLKDLVSKIFGSGGVPAHADENADENADMREDPLSEFGPLQSGKKDSKLGDSIEDLDLLPLANTEGIPAGSSAEWDEVVDLDE